ncbi:MAG: radical SAM protein [Planctomycetota bacterium]
MHDVARLVSDPPTLDRLRAALADPAQVPPLRDLKLKVTSRCNLRCQMCDYWQTRSEETLGNDEWARVLTDARALGARKIHLSGGEPFLRRDLVPLLEHACSLGLKVNLTTNGTLTTREQARALAKAGVNAVSISFDGPSARLHDQIRGREGAFARSRQTARWLVREAKRARSKLKLRINFVLMPENYKRAAEMVRFAAELGAVDLVAMPVDHEDPEQRLSRGQLETYNAEVAPEVARARAEVGFSGAPERVFPFGTSAQDLDYAKLGRYARGYFERHTCYAPWLHAFLAWNGDVFLCCMTTNAMAPLGNVRSTPLGEVLAGPRYQEVRRDFLAGRRHPNCHRCDLFLPENARLEAALAPPRGRRLLVVDA